MSKFLRNSWIEAQCYIHRHSCFGSVLRTLDWTSVGWTAFGRGVVISMAERDDIDPPPITEIPGTQWFVETDIHHTKLNRQLTEDGWRVTIELPGHSISTDKEFLGQFDQRDKDVHIVCASKALEDFAWVQDMAYTEEYDVPRGVGRSFYVHLESVHSLNAYGVTLYKEGAPARVAYIIRALGIAQGVGGAVNPQFRGQHLGESLWPCLGGIARDVWNTSFVHHVSMPCAVPIMKRHGFREISRFLRWQKLS